MKSYKQNGWRGIEHPPYTEGGKSPRLLQESSAIGDYEDSQDNPGSSFLWWGEHHHLNREEVQILQNATGHWSATGRLPEDLKVSGEEEEKMDPVLRIKKALEELNPNTCPSCGYSFPEHRLHPVGGSPYNVFYSCEQCGVRSKDVARATLMGMLFGTEEETAEE